MLLPTPSLNTARLRLRPFIQADAEAVFALNSNPRVLRYWDSPPWKDRAQANRFLTICEQMQQDGTGARLAIERADNAAFLGWCNLFNWNPVHRSAKLGYCLDIPAWGQGFATEAAHALLQWSFNALDLNRVQSETDTRNIASNRVLEKLGFTHEGTLRQDCIVDGEISDSRVYGLLRQDWEQTPNRLVSNSPTNRALPLPPNAHPGRENTG